MCNYVDCKIQSDSWGDVQSTYLQNCLCIRVCVLVNTLIKAFKHPHFLNAELGMLVEGE